METNYMQLLEAAITQNKTTQEILSDLETLIKLKKIVNKNRDIKKELEK
jgi:hypothetical protein